MKTFYLDSLTLGFLLKESAFNKNGVATLRVGECLLWCSVCENVVDLFAWFDSDDGVSFERGAVAV